MKNYDKFIGSISWTEYIWIPNFSKSKYIYILYFSDFKMNFFLKYFILSFRFYSFSWILHHFVFRNFMCWKFVFKAFYENFVKDIVVVATLCVTFTIGSLDRGAIISNIQTVFLLCDAFWHSFKARLVFVLNVLFVSHTKILFHSIGHKTKFYHYF